MTSSDLIRRLLRDPQGVDLSNPIDPWMQNIHLMISAPNLVCRIAAVKCHAND